MSWEYNALIGMAIAGFFGVWQHSRIINRHADEIENMKESLRAVYSELHNEISELEERYARDRQKMYAQSETDRKKWAHYEAWQKKMMRSRLCVTLHEIMQKKEI